ncbi:MAG TPA: hypothetical protein HPP56_09105 [Nitrospirae bacterium]|nr:hypothetical protein [Nitrospirota bacterium]
MQCLLLKFLKISFIRCRIKIPHQPFLLYLFDFIRFSVLLLIWDKQINLDFNFFKMVLNSVFFQYINSVLLGGFLNANL